MKPYLTENLPLATLIEWGGLVLVLALVLSPFFIIRLQRFKPTRWRHIVGAYVSSLAIYFAIEFLISKIDRWLLENFINTSWIQTPFEEILFKITIFLLFFYPISTFYSTKMLFQRFTKLNLFFSILIAITIFFLISLTLIIGGARALGESLN